MLAGAALAAMAIASVAGVGVSAWQSEEARKQSAAQYAEQKAAYEKAQADAKKQERINLMLGVAGIILSVASMAMLYYLYTRRA